MQRDSATVASVAVAAVLLAVAVVASFVLTPGPGPVTGQEAVDEFLAAWRASRLGTYVAETTFEREAPNGTLTAPGRIVQRPPDRIVEQFGGVDGRLAGKVLRCATDPAGRYACTQEAGAGDYEEDVDRELATLASYFVEPKPLYRVSGDGHGCFRLALSLAFPSAPYGDGAQFCFDEATGAPLLTRIVREEGTDTTRTTTVRADVTDEDLEVPDQPPEASTG